MTVYPLRIALLGELRAGKDTVANMIAEKIKHESVNTPVVFLAFADGIHKVINLVMPEVYKLGKPRRQLQHIGQSMRQLDKDVWVNMLFNSFEYRDSVARCHNIIVTDVRQPNEVERLHKEGFVVIKVIADKEIRIQRVLEAGDNFSPDMLEHETEKVLHECPYDYLIDNSSTIGDLERSISKIFEEVLEIYGQGKQAD